RRRVHRGRRRELRPGQPVRAALRLRELRDVRLRRRIVHALHHPVQVGPGAVPATRPRGERSPAAGAACTAPPHPCRRRVPSDRWLGGVHYHRPMLRLLTAGESHGKGLGAILGGLPAGASGAPKTVAAELGRRRTGYGRGGRQRFEADAFEIVSGVRHGRTIGSPIAVTIPNVEWETKYRELMAVDGEPDPGARLTRPRP